MTYAEFTQRFEFDPDADQLGEGGFAKVFKAWDNVRREEVALKLAPVRPDQEVFSLRQEYELVKNLAQGNIALYLDCHRIVFPFVGTHDVAWMKYYEAGHLGQLLSRQQLTEEQKRRILLGILEGLEYLHTRQPFIIHRDLKPANILIVPRAGQFIPLITDFGISRRALDTDNSHVTNTVKALSLHFAAPEQGDSGELRPNADLWSFGVLIAYVWLNGMLPFRDQGLDLESETGQRQLRQRILSLDILPLVWQRVPEPWLAVLRACLVVDPHQRIKSCQAVRGILAPEKVTTARPSLPLGAEETTVLTNKSESVSSHGAERPPLVEVKLELPRLDPELSKLTPPKAASANPLKQGLLLRPRLRWVMGGIGVVLLGWFWILSRQKYFPVMPDGVAKTLAEINAQMKPIPGGEFTYGLVPSVEGSPFWREPREPLQLWVNDFLLSSLEVTNEQWRRVMGSSVASANDSCAQCPVEGVSRLQAQAFIDSLNFWTDRSFRLPTDQEWEYAAKGERGNTYRLYAGSDDFRMTSWFKDISNGHSQRVGLMQANAFGLYDMCGNVEEWTLTKGNRDFAGKSFSGIFVRGGSYLDSSKDRSVSFRRVVQQADYQEPGLGFRLAH